jgi:tetratricopeptide (TPR) repeat protein
MPDQNGVPPARTVLEQKIRERRQTLEEFITYVEDFRRQHNEPGTLTPRHLQRLIAGHRGDGRPLGPLRPATARLLEHIFGMTVAELLAAPGRTDQQDLATELRQRLGASGRIDDAVIGLLREQLNALRRVDRQLGAIVAYDEVTAKAAQIAVLHSHSLSSGTRVKLAALLAELSTLAGWEALDRSAVTQAWEHHEHAKRAAHEANSSILLAHSLAQQAVVLTDVGECHAAIEQLAEARRVARRSAPALLRSWLAAAYGEGLAAAGRRNDALRAFDVAHALLPSDQVDPELPFLFLSGAHLDRWQGHALARLGDREAVNVLTNALMRLDPSFMRAAAAVRVDLAIALTATGQLEQARVQAELAEGLAIEIGSARQQRRIRTLFTNQLTW